MTTNLAPEKPPKLQCPNDGEYGCHGPSKRRHITFLYSVSEAWGSVVTRHDVYRCRCCHTRFVSTNGGEPQEASDQI